MSTSVEGRRCLNCSAVLRGPFCASCGQRAVPPEPTVKELIGEAWQELSGYDGRIMATLRGLVRPGFLTREYVNGRRAHYLSPLKTYLTVSVVYFLIAAAVPQQAVARRTEAAAQDGVRISFTDRTGGDMTAEERAELLKQAEQAGWFMGPLLRSVAQDPEAMRQRIFTLMPRVFFALLPVFAGIVWLFYRRRTFPTALVFAVHVHALAFVVFAISEAAKLSGSTVLAAAVAATALVIFTGYTLQAIRVVFGGGWPMTILKSLAIGALYSLSALPAFFAMLLWAAWI
jgi:hypothetical protein